MKKISHHIQTTEINDNSNYLYFVLILGCENLLIHFKTPRKPFQKSSAANETVVSDTLFGISEI